MSRFEVPVVEATADSTVYPSRVWAVNEYCPCNMRLNESIDVYALKHEEQLRISTGSKMPFVSSK